ncbi:MAG: hypothetical protein A2Y34_06340 [Spirochaetes bacterium GWC1_27_15]|nr:MAG: hypothetical protein A2Z98_17370 [Spirochaetes bacterium GWB1_27_13]OHD21280.1 MAG: hypothetical protein A2Y34_06340 [Spirochaetes bacterium GWC1_27_15]
MAKIEDYSYIFNPDSFKKTENKKTENKKIIGKEHKKSFFEEVFFQNTEIQQEEKINKQEELEKLLKEIGIQGELLKKSRNLEDLDDYKKMVKKYLMSVIEQGEKIENKVTFHRIKKEKVAKVHLQIIDKELIELTRIFLSEQYNTLDIASKIDKIEGILVDLSS